MISALKQLQTLRARASLTSDALLSGNKQLNGFLQGFLLGELVLLYGSSISYSLTDLLISQALRRPEKHVVYVDGGNRFNLYRIVSLVNQIGVDVEWSLSRIHVSRAFTSHQLATLIRRELSQELEQHPSRLIVISDLLSISRDDEVETRETRNMLSLTLRSLRKLTTRAQTITLLPNSMLANKRERSGLQTLIWPKADIILRTHELKNRTRLVVEKHPLGPREVDWDLSNLRVAA